MDFQQALNTVLADLTPQPWDHTTPDGTTLRVIPAGLRDDPGRAEVLIRLTRADVTGLYDYGLTGPDTQGAAEYGVTTTDLPTLITALEGHTHWEHAAGFGDPTRLHLTAALDLTITEGHPTHGRQWAEVTVSTQLSETQRLPLASALRRALDVARDWEQ